MPEKTKFRCNSLIFIPLMVLVTGSLMAQDVYMWKKRVIILQFIPSDSSKWKVQQDILNEDPDEIADRDLVVVDYEEAERLNLLPEKVLDEPLTDTGFRFYLRGKDGGVKLTSEEPVALEKLFAIIDAMPMRRQEIKRKGGQ